MDLGLVEIQPCSGFYLPCFVTSFESVEGKLLRVGEDVRVGLLSLS